MATRPAGPAAARAARKGDEEEDAGCGWAGGRKEAVPVPPGREKVAAEAQVVGTLARPDGALLRPGPKAGPDARWVGRAATPGHLGGVHLATTAARRPRGGAGGEGRMQKNRECDLRRRSSQLTLSSRAASTSGARARTLGPSQCPATPAARSRPQPPPPPSPPPKRPAASVRWSWATGRPQRNSA